MSCPRGFHMRPTHARPQATPGCRAWSWTNGRFANGLFDLNYNCWTKAERGWDRRGNKDVVSGRMP